VSKYFDGANPLGRRLGNVGATSSRDRVIVGVVADSKRRSLRDKAEPSVYYPLLQEESQGSWTLHVRTSSRAVDWASHIRREVARFDPNLDVWQVTTLWERVNLSLRRERLFATLTTLLAVAALVLASVGLYGTQAHAVARRTSEIGVRMALGASRGRILLTTLREAITVTAIGAMIGLPIAAAGLRLLRALLFGLSSFDLGVVVAAITTLLVTALFAGFVPAWRAAKIDPVEALRCE
jgi:ABC-type antimicrobial peptide transport system permease subunit